MRRPPTRPGEAPRSRPRRVLPVIVISQFLCTSLWFAGNAILPDLAMTLQPDAGLLANLTSGVQLGFITGTLLFAILAISDRFSPSSVFFACSIMAALANLGMCLPRINASELLFFRALTGFFLAGIYPVGMKITSDYFEEGLGQSLGFLVGALVIGTATSHLLKSFSSALPWRFVVYATSILCLSGGTAIRLLVPDGPYRTPGRKLELRALGKAFGNTHFRAAAIGYFGHMWELYTFWAFVPTMLFADHVGTPNVALLSFVIIGAGGIACIIGGIYSQHFGAKRLATLFLCLSCACCLLSPLALHENFALRLCFLIFWGWVVVADSPLFSSLIARNAPSSQRGSALTLINCIGFAITIVSIKTISLCQQHIDSRYLYLLLAPGPLFGIAALFRDRNTNHSNSNIPN